MSVRERPRVVYDTKYKESARTHARTHTHTHTIHMHTQTHFQISAFEMCMLVCLWMVPADTIEI